MKTLIFAILFALVCASQASAQYGINNPQAMGWQQNYEYQPQAYYDQYGRLVVKTGRDTVDSTAYDPHRHIIDPGSQRYVDRTYYDQYGRLIRQQGWVWTSYGFAHGNTTTTVISNVGGGFQNQDTTVHMRDTSRRFYAPGPPGYRRDTTNRAFSRR